MRNYHVLPTGFIRFAFFLLLGVSLLPEYAFPQGLNLFGRKKITRHINPVTGFSDNVYDRFGKKYRYTKIAASNQNNISPKSFKAGWFNVFFAKGCGMDEDSSSLHIERRKVLFEVLSNISGMIKVPDNGGTFTGANLLVDKLSNHLPDHISAPGVGSSFYAFPRLPSNSYPGIVDGFIHRALCTGNSPWPGNEAGNMLDGFIAVNFDNADIKWNLDTKKDCAADEYDLYTVCLREIMHALGFASLIGTNGSSVFGKENNYYCRYDMFLTTTDMAPLISYSATSYPLYDLQFNVPVNILHSGDSATKNKICFYDSVYKIPVCLSCAGEAESSLGYFCRDGKIGKKMEHGVMNCADFRGYTVRTLNPREKQVLCDLKYPLADCSAAQKYSSVSDQVWGCNDGIVQKKFIYKSEGGQIAIPKWGINGILSNDSKIVIDASFIRNIYTESGYVANNPREIIFTPAPDFSGETILEYIPVDGKGNYGNITFICVSVSKNKQKRKSADKK